VAAIHRNRLFQQCLVSALSGTDRFTVTGMDYKNPQALAALEDDPPDILLIDMHLPEQLALELTRIVRKRFSEGKVVVLTYSSAHEDLFECIASGAHGLVLENSTLEELRAAIEKVLGGETFCSPGIIGSMFARIAEAHSEPRPPKLPEQAGVGRLTARELEVLDLIAEGLSNKEIAKRLYLAIHTVKNHVHNIVEKLHVRSRFAAVEWARKSHCLQRRP
jgi:DNA-binding NarL/FixJ family response regulator